MSPAPLPPRAAASASSTRPRATSRTTTARSAGRLDVPALGEAADAARLLLDQLASATARHDLHGYPAAQNVGVTAARARAGVGDRFLERNQALRIAVLDVQHVATLLGYLSRASEANGDDDLVEFCDSWQETLAVVEAKVRQAAIDLGSRPRRLDRAARLVADRPRRARRRLLGRDVRRVVRPPRRQPLARGRAEPAAPARVSTSSS